ncbi:MAG: FtsW/RodA/SpoVE family cell cycle protein [bacterium JZ-2024 1]
MDEMAIEPRLHQRVVWSTLILVMAGATGLYTAMVDTDWDGRFLRQAPLYFIGVALFVFAHLLPSDLILRLSRPVFWIAFALMAVLALPLSGREVNRNINLILFPLQPWEIYKLALVFFLARLLWEVRRNFLRPESGAARLLGITGISIFLLAVQPDLDAIGFLVMATVALVVFSQAFPPRMTLGFMGVTAALSVVLLLGGFYMVRPNKGEQAFKHDTQTRQHIEYAVIRGGATGVGWAAGREKYFIPAVHTDMIAGHLTESVGGVGLFLMLVLYLILIMTGLEVARRHPGHWQRIVALGISLIIANQVFVNLLIAFQVSPIVAGIPLPFVSLGGSALLMNITEAGFLARFALEVDRTQ